jgi:cephalosporin hydroxylase
LRLGDLGEAMKKKSLFILFLMCLISTVQAEIKVDDVKNKVCTVLPSIYGWCSQEKALNFIDLVIEVQPQVCVEIGVFGGSSLFPVACALKFLRKGIIYGIDPWDKGECIKYYDSKKDEANIQWWTSINLEAIYNAYMNMIKRFGLEKYCKTIRSTSEKAVSNIIADIDILHIDGNHSEASFLQDVMLYFPKVRSGGYIWLNDALWDEAQPAADFLLQHCVMVKLIDNGNCVLFRKN